MLRRTTQALRYIFTGKLPSDLQYLPKVNVENNEQALILLLEGDLNGCEESLRFQIAEVKRMFNDFL